MPEIDVEGRWYGERETQAYFEPTTLGESIKLLRGRSWLCACIGPPACCVDAYVHARVMRRAAHILVKMVAEVAAR